MHGRIAIAILLFCQFSAKAEVTFEGYYKIETKGKHVGFSVVREEIDPRSQLRTARYFVHTIDRDGKLEQVMTVVRQTADYRPLDYECRSTVSGKTVTEKVIFNQQSYAETFQDKDGKTQKQHASNPDAILESMVNHVLVSNRPQKGKIYSYDAVEEETAKLGHANIRVLEVKNGIYQILDDFENDATESWILSDGETLFSRIPDWQVTSTLVDGADLAIAELDFKRSDLVQWFQDIPRGKVNAISNKKVRFDKNLFTAKVDTKYRPVQDAIRLRLPGSVAKPNVSK